MRNGTDFAVEAATTEPLRALPDPAPGVRCWALALERAPEEVLALERVLASAERMRADRFGTAALRARYVVGRAMLRHLLGELLGMAPGEVPMHRGRRGRPQIDSATGLDFNITHTRSLAIVGVVAGARIGVDVEHEDREANADGLARKFMTQAEQASLTRLPADERRRRFLRLWTCKEAMSKATGDALSAPFRSLDVEVDHGPRLIAGPVPYQPADWSLHEVAALPGFLATAAVWRR